MPLDDVPAEKSVYDSAPDPALIPEVPEDPADPEDPEGEQGEAVPEFEEVSATFAPYDPSGYSANFRPPTTTPVEPQTPAGQGAGAPPAEAPVEFDPKVKQEFEGLLFVGALTTTFDYLGHRFVLRTLTQDELLEIALAIKPYVDTSAEVKANMMAIVAACVVSVDGRALPHPITLDTGDTVFQNHWRYVRANWYPPVIDAVFNQYVVLEWKVQEVIAAMGNRSG